jgi:hypothetical protein
MAAADNLQKNAPAPIAIPGLGRALISAGKVSQQAAENAAKKAATGKTRSSPSSASLAKSAHWKLPKPFP